MKDFKDMTKEEKVAKLTELYNQLTPENKAKARAYAHELWLQEQKSSSIAE